MTMNTKIQYYLQKYNHESEAYNFISRASGETTLAANGGSECRFWCDYENTTAVVSEGFQLVVARKEARQPQPVRQCRAVECAGPTQDTLF